MPFSKKIYLTLFIALTGFISVFAQKHIYDASLGKNESLSYSSEPVISRGIANTFNFLPPIDEIWGRSDWPFEGVDFKPLQNLVTIGDINGDGIDDFMKSMGLQVDNRTNEIAEYAYRTLIHYGGTSISSEPDQIFYELIHPAGDLNNDEYSDAISSSYNGIVELLLGSPAGYQRASLSELDEFYFSFIASGHSLIDLDFNGDNIDDFLTLTFENDSVGYFAIFYGSKSLLDEPISQRFVSDTLVNIDLEGIELAGLFQKNGTRYIAVSGFDLISSPDQFVIRFYELSDNGQLIYHSEKKLLSNNFVSMYRTTLFKDFTGNGDPDLLIRVRESGLYSLYLSTFSTDSLSLFHAIQEPLIEELFWVETAGDLDENGKENLIIIGGDRSFFTIGEVDTTDETFAFQSQDFINASGFANDAVFYNDRIFLDPEVNFKRSSSHITLADSSKGFTMLFEEDEEFGNVIFTYPGDPGTLSTDDVIETLRYEIENYEKRRITEVFYLGDIENDGVDNFAVKEEKGSTYYLTFYNGFNEDTRSSFQSSTTLNPLTVFSGNFLGDSNNEIVVQYYENVNEQYLIYYDGINLNEVEEFNLNANLEVDGNFLNDVPIVSNLGDINNNGYNDIGISTPIGFPSSSFNQHLFILLGNELRKPEPDLTIDIWHNIRHLYPQQPEEFPIQAGYSLIQGVGDINGDGIDDFATSYRNRNFPNRPLREFSGSVFLFFGQDSTKPSFIKPNLELLPDTASLNGIQDDFGAYHELAVGDFNGDGLSDFAAKATSYYRFDDWLEGSNAINFYYGSEDFTGNPDFSIPIRKEYTDPFAASTEYSYVRSMGTVLMSAIDIDRDEKDELLIVPGSSSGLPNVYTNALIYKVEDEPDEYPEYIFTGLHPNYTLNPHNLYVNHQLESMVGDFTGDGNLEFIAYQPDLENYLDTPLLLYSLNLQQTSSENDREISTLPDTYKLHQNYPNPFNPTTNISFSIPRTTEVSLTLYDLLGRKVLTLFSGRLESGTHTFPVNLAQLSSGVYLYKLEASDFINIKKMTLIK